MISPEGSCLGYHTYVSVFFYSSRIHGLSTYSHGCRIWIVQLSFIFIINVILLIHDFDFLFLYFFAFKKRKHAGKEEVVVGRFANLMSNGEEIKKQKIEVMNE